MTTFWKDDSFFNRLWGLFDNLRWLSFITQNSVLILHSFILYNSLSLSGMVGLMGTATLTKKRMGYTNTKLHGIIAWAGMLSSYAGFYVIYTNKNSMGKDHYTTLHSKAGLAALVGSTMLGMAGGVFLHPDFGIDKQNGLIRAGHKWAARGMLGVAWLATLSGLQTLIGEEDVKGLVMFAAPLVLAAPFTLL